MFLAWYRLSGGRLRLQKITGVTYGITRKSDGDCKLKSRKPVTMCWNYELNCYLPHDASRLSVERRQVIDGEQCHVDLGISRVHLDGSCETGHHQTRPGIGGYRWPHSIVEGPAGRTSVLVPAQRSCIVAVAEERAECR
jgi:hypothetical protein